MCNLGKAHAFEFGYPIAFFRYDFDMSHGSFALHAIHLRTQLLLVSKVSDHIT